MGIILAENFNIAETTHANIRTALAAKNITPLAAPVMWFNSVIATQTENGVTRPYFRFQTNYYNGSGPAFDSIGLPLTNSTNPFYLSFRIRFPQTTALSTLVQFSVRTQNIVGANNVGLVHFENTGSQINIYPGYGAATSANGFIQLPFDTWVMVEVYRGADGKVKVWVNDLLLPGLSTYVSTAPLAADPRVYLGPYRPNTYIQTMPTWDISDVVLVDAATTGLQNRVGSSGRVETVPYTADVAANWTPPAGVTAAHNTLMTSWNAVPDTAKILTGNAVGQRDTYQMGAVPKSRADNNILLAVGLERRASNGGAASHSYASELDLGAGNVEVDNVTLAAGAGYAYNPKFMEKKPDGTNWSMADVAAMKSGFVVKS